MYISTKFQIKFLINCGMKMTWPFIQYIRAIIMFINIYKIIRMVKRSININIFVYIVCLFFFFCFFFCNKSLQSSKSTFIVKLFEEYDLNFKIISNIGNNIKKLLFKYNYYTIYHFQHKFKI